MRPEGLGIGAHGGHGIFERGEFARLADILADARQGAGFQPRAHVIQHQLVQADALPWRQHARVRTHDLESPGERGGT
ncbi:hypothetical protein D3C71_2103810 [compost metagenome]